MSDAPTSTFVAASALATTPRVRVQFQARTCNCGCEGRDYQHSKELARTLRDIEVLATPRPFPAERRAFASSYVILATATVRAPWGADVEVWAVAYTADGRALGGGTLASWEYARMGC